MGIIGILSGQEQEEEEEEEEEEMVHCEEELERSIIELAGLFTHCEIIATREVLEVTVAIQQSDGQCHVQSLLEVAFEDQIVHRSKEG